jgi:hypothetical protein
MRKPFLTLAFAAFGCTGPLREGSPPSTPAVAKIQKSPPAIVPWLVDYRVTNPADGDALVASGVVGMSSEQPANVKQMESQSPAVVELWFDGRPLPEERLWLRVHYRESTAAGGRIAWEGSWVVKRQDTAGTRVVGPGGGRTFTLAVR